jgi:hypothetical protein
MAFSKLEKAMALVIGIDIATPGFSRAAAKAAVAAIGRIAPPAVRATTGIAAANPYATGALLGGAALASPPGQQLLDIAAERGRMDRIKFEQALTNLTQTTLPRAKARSKSKFNKMVSAGMTKIKASTSYGKKGTISNAKKAFAAVTKAASAVTKGKKAPRRGIKGTLMRFMRKI